MRPIRLIVLLAIILPAAVLAPAARAQSAGTPPTARALLPASVLATLLQNSVHVAGKVNLTAMGVPAGSVDITGDLAWRDQVQVSLHLQTASPALQAALGGSTVDLVISGQKSAVRVGTGSWSCSGATGGSASTVTASGGTKGKSGKTKGKKAKKSSNGSASVSGSASGTATAGMVTALPKFGQPVDLGAASIGGVAVWHVQAQSAQSAASAATLDVYITQSDLTVKRVALAATTTAAPSVTIAATVDLSQYGEPVSVSLPAGCAGSARAVTSAQAALLRAVTRIFMPGTLISLLLR